MTLTKPSLEIISWIVFFWINLIGYDCGFIKLILDIVKVYDVYGQDGKSQMNIGL